MKISKKELQEIIAAELLTVLNEQDTKDPSGLIRQGLDIGLGPNINNTLSSLTGDAAIKKRILDMSTLLVINLRRMYSIIEMQQEQIKNLSELVTTPDKESNMEASKREQNT